MKPFIKKLLIPAALAASVAVAVPAVTSGEFDLTGLNAQVQNHETRITTLENAPTPTPQVIVETVPGATLGGAVQTDAVTGQNLTSPTNAPVPSTNVITTTQPTPSPTPYYCPQTGPGNTSCTITTAGSVDGPGTGPGFH